MRTSLSSSNEASIIDCDLWAQKATFALIGPYLSSSWRGWLRIGEEMKTAISKIDFPESQYFVEGPALKSAASGGDAVADAVAYLDRNAIQSAIFNPGAASSLAGLSSPLLAAATATAVNDWTVGEWLEADRRLLGSIVVSLGDPRQAAEEIRRTAANERMVQVVFAFPPRSLGDRAFAPVYDAACETGLPVMLQSGGDYSGTNPGPSAIGNPTSTFEAFVAWEYGAQPQLISLITNGVFDRFPSLRVVLNGFGVAWLPSVLWRLDHEFRAGRVQAPPGLKRLPSEYVTDHVRSTTAQLERSENPDHLAALLSLIGGERLLVFASGQLRGDPATDLAALDALPDGWREQLHANAVELYPIAAREALRSP